MPAVNITTDDILVFNPDLDPDQVEILIRDGLALARRAAPCIDQEDFLYPEAAEAVIRSAILRWAESGSGAITQESSTAGPWSFQQTFDTRSARRSLFWPSEVTELQRLCQTSGQGAFSIDTIPTNGACSHSPECSVRFGGVCSCGSVLNADRGALW
ncbi:hypothetical protein HMPREF3088_05340 [Corynebacterium sp. HMSC22B11]|uniref:hypothetical protein n=1 Tax=Corynebacterium sp. HMSC22B11 TaxID=1581056 RepID=UPI0008A135AA|nr:hypothetical protein [Corynebacterium sp. HMSC22B11]OFO13749.1 hypothetical protein HMPREF3088_05340 [Corynebacterium sp. HMSC22B11]